jgi:hypothetical protein
MRSQPKVNILDGRITTDYAFAILGQPQNCRVIADA